MFVIGISVASVIVTMINWPQVEKLWTIAFVGLILFFCSYTYSIVYLRFNSVTNSLLNSLALNVTPLILMIET
jgi:hypothetical protein